MPTMVAATLYDGSGSATRAEIEPDAGRKVSCGFTHPIISTPTTTLRTLLKKRFRHESPLHKMIRFGIATDHK